MKKVSLIFLGFFFVFSMISCGSKDAESDNDSGLTDNESVTDDLSDEVLTESDETNDEAVDDATDETTDETTDNGMPDETVDETTDEITDETADEVNDESTDETVDEENDEEVTDDTLPPPSAEALACCQEIVKEWFRCEGTYETTAVQGCVDCFAALSTCTDFYIAENSFGCSAECDAICEGTGTADNSGKDRRKVADGYCKFVMDKNCDISPEDVSSFGVVEGLDACYDE